jgi:1,4-dihydroxy-2-naphthoate octaprenyltransferase
VVAPDRVSGWDEQRVPFVEYCERNLSQANRYMARLSEQRGSPVAPHLPLRWRLFLATRLPFLTATLVPIFLGAAIARAHGYSAWWLSVLALAGASCIHLGLNVLNDIFDVSSGADIENVTPTPFSGGSRVVLYGLVSRRSMWALALIFFIVGGGIGLYLGFTRATVIIWLGVAGVALSIAYTAPPFKLVYRGLGDVAVATGFGPIMTIGSYVVVARHLSFEALYASLPVSLFVMLILYVNQVPDRLGDGRAGKRTVVVRFRRSSIIRAYDVLAATGFALIVAGVAAGITPFWTLLALGPIPLAVRVHRGLTAHYDEPFALIPALASNIGLHLFTGIGLIFGYALDTAI